MREQTADQVLFLGRIRPEDRAKATDSPLVRTWDGEPAAVWDYGSTGAPHGRAIGTTGGGKSSLGRMVGRGLVRKPGPRAITFIDGEGAGEYSMFKRMLGVAQIVNVNPAADRKLDKGQPTSVERAVQTLADHLTLAVERNEEMLAAQEAWEAYLVDPSHQRPPAYVPPAEVWLFVDGWASLRHNVNRYHRGKVDVIEDLTLTGRVGRKVDVHLFILDQVTYASRSKDDTGMPSELKKQLALSIAAVGRHGLTKSEGGMAFDDQDAGLLVPKVPGGCLMQVGNSRVPFVVPRWDNATDPRANLTLDERRAAYRLLGPPVEGAA